MAERTHGFICLSRNCLTECGGKIPQTSISFSFCTSSQSLVLFHYHDLFLTFFSGRIVVAQYFPPPIEGAMVLNSRFHSGIRISYQEGSSKSLYYNPASNWFRHHLWDDTKCTCLEWLCSPSSWWFKSVPYQHILLVHRISEDSLNAPLAIRLNGGWGASPTASVLDENGHCIVQDDSNSTDLNQ